MLIVWTICNVMLISPVYLGTFDMERILRLMRPSKDEVLIKRKWYACCRKFYYESLPNVLANLFSSVSRGGEVLLNNCLKRVKQLYKETINLKCIQNLFHFLKVQLQLISM